MIGLKKESCIMTSQKKKYEGKIPKAFEICCQK